MIPASSADWERYLLELTRELHRAGTNSPRLEAIFQAVCRAKGLEGVLSATPTMLFAAFGPTGAQRVALLREAPGDIDLGRLTALQALAEDSVRRLDHPDAGFAELARLRSLPRAYPLAWTLFAHGLASASASVFFAGRLIELPITFVLGALLGGLSHLGPRHRLIGRLLVPLSGVIASALAVLAARAIEGVSFATIAISALIVLLPGLTLTTAIKELAAGHLASGSTRFFSAATTLALIGVGVAVGGRVFGAAPPEPLRESPYFFATLAAAATAALAFGILFKAARRHFTAIATAAFIAVIALKIGQLFASPVATAFLAAFAVGVAGNVHSWWRRVPAAVMQVPGSLLLVPGSVGLRSVLALLGEDVERGVAAAFAAVTTSGALASGLVLANLLVPGRPLDEQE